jgi:hypothetical protein
MTLPERTLPDFSTVLGKVVQPTSGRIEAAIAFDERTREFKIDFSLFNARVPVTDGTTSGSYGTLKIFDFIQSGIAFHGCRQDYTKTKEGSALTTAAGDAVYVWGVGSAAASTARDGTLTTTEQDIGTKTSQITNSSGTGAGTQIDGAKTAAFDGTSSAKSLYLNWSGTAATIDASSNIDVTGTITVSGVLLGDD